MSELLSPGVAYGCFELLDILAKSPLLVSAARSLGKLGVVSANRATDCTLLLGWAERTDDGLLVISPQGAAILGMQLTDQRLRQALLDIVYAENPPWAQNASFGRRRFLQYAPTEIAQICCEAGLDSGNSDEVVAFWDMLASRARGLHDVRLNEIGRHGERLTLQYEAKRTSRTPKWIALDSNEDGYDILSTISAEDTSKLCIEVKASQQGISGRFFLTRHEWETAKVLLNYKMHLWDLSTSPARLAVLELPILEEHIPIDQNDGSWQTTCISFASFSNLFRPLDFDAPC